MPWDQFNYTPPSTPSGNSNPGNFGAPTSFDNLYRPPNPLAGGGGTSTAGGIGVPNPITSPSQPNQPSQPSQPQTSNSGWRPMDYQTAEERTKAWLAAGRPDRDYQGNVVTASTGGGNMMWNGQMYGGPGSRMGQDNGFGASLYSQGSAPAGGFTPQGYSVPQGTASAGGWIPGQWNI